MINKQQPCLCGKNKNWQQCCGRFLDGSEHAKTAEQLMRSRYSAYAAGGYGDYLLATWHPATAGGLSAAELSIKSHNWCGLEVLDKAQEGDKATVEFIAWHKSEEAEGASQRDGQWVQSLHEKSSFVRIHSRWLYVGGEIS